VKHTRHCIDNAESTVTEELHLQELWEDTYPHANGVDLIIPAWSMTVAQVRDMWLSDGTVTCRCDD
jgi:hypothetical protein